MKGRSNTSKQTQVSEDLMLPLFCNPLPTEERLFMPVSQVETKKTTSQVKSEKCEAVTPTTKSSKTSEAVSTSKEKDCKPYWTPSCLEKSQKLLSLTETACVGSDLNFSNPWPINTTVGSWFSTTLHSAPKPNSSKTSFPSFTFFPPDFTVSGGTVVRSKKIRIYPKAENLPRWKKYLGLTRYWFNKAVEYLKGEDTKASLQEVRRLQQKEHPDWALDCPQRIREHAFADAVGAVKNAKLKYKKTGQFQEVSWRTRKDPRQRFGFDKNSIQEDFIFAKHHDRLYFTSSEGSVAELEGTEVVFENGRWFAILPQRRCVVKPENQRQPIIALDPGVRTFMSLYGLGVYGDFGKGDFGRIRRLCCHLDELMSKIAKSKRRQRQRMKKASQRLRWRIRNLVDDLHKKLAYFLVTRFDVILLPTFETQKMVSKLHSKTARAMMTWAHYRFKQHLKAKAEEYSAVVVDVNEAYTSKTCSYCGKIHNIGSKKRMRCSCGVDVDRDHQGARGILLRALSVTTSPTQDCMDSRAWNPSQILHLLAKL